MIYNSQDIKYSLTHNVPNAYVKRVIDGKFKLYKACNKPTGIWISINNGWERFCVNEGLYKGGNTTQFNVKLHQNLKIIMIEKMSDFEELWTKYTDYKIPTYMFTKTEVEIIQNFYKWIKSQNVHGFGLTENAIKETKYTFLCGWDCESLVLFNPKDMILKPIEK